MVESALEKTNKEIAELNIQDVEALTKKRDQLEHQQRQIPKDLVKIENQQVRLIKKYGWSIYGYSSLKESANVLQSFRSERKLPAEYNDQFINSLLKDEKCICQGMRI